MDYSVKPSLFTYDLRSKTADFSNSVKAQHHEDALLALVDRQLDVAAAKMRMHQHKHALDLLHRTYSLVLQQKSSHNHSLLAPPLQRPQTSPVQTEECSSLNQADVRPGTSPTQMDTLSAPTPAKEGETHPYPVVVKLSIAAIRMQLCNALSQLGRHTQALEEASQAKNELDVLWAEMKASVETSRNQVEPPMQRQMCKPRWLERAVVSSIQTRLLMAAEMEFLLPHSEVQVALEVDVAMEAKETDESDFTHGSAPIRHRVQRPTAQNISKVTPGTPVAPPSQGQTMRRLYCEAVTLAARLLPEDHRASKQALQMETEALSRWKQALVRWQQDMANFRQVKVKAQGADGQLKVQAQGSPPTAAASQNPAWNQTAADARQGSIHEENNHVSSKLLDPSSLNSFTSKLLDSSSLNSFRSTCSGTTDSFRDITSAASSVGSLGTPLLRSSSAPAGKKKQKKDPPERAQSVEKLDPFADWQKNCMSKQDMTVFQSELLTHEGIERLHTKMKFEHVKFKHFMRDLAATHDADERFHDMRTYYTKSGVVATKVGQAKMDAIRKAAMHPSDFSIKMAKREEGLFEYYGLSKQVQSPVGVRDLRKLMEASTDSSEEKRASRRRKRR